MSTAARLPPPLCEQLELPLFEPPSFDDLMCGKRTRSLSVRLNNRLRTTWHVILDPLSGARELVVPAPVKRAPEGVKRALLDWAQLPWRPRGANRSAVLRRKTDLERLVRRYLRESGIDSGVRRRVDPRRYVNRTKGVKYDLCEIRDTLNAAYFSGKVKTYVRWGAYASATSYQAVRTDPDGNPFSLITVAGVYDHPDVPRFAVEAVVFHEMLHVVMPVSTRNGRNIIHGPAFKRAERAFPNWREWRNWERGNLNKLIRSLKRKARRALRTRGKDTVCRTGA